jgi:excisionase family DNA binding protein
MSRKSSQVSGETPQFKHSTELPKLLRYREVAAQLGLSVSFVKREVLANRIASVTLGTARRVPQTEVDRLVRHGLDAA